MPRNLQATAGVQKITLTWAANTEPELTGYEVLRFTDPTDETPDKTFSSVLTTYVDTPVTAGQPFVYRVRAVGTANEKSELSAFVSAQAIEPPPVLAAPRNVRATAGIGYIAITWAANTEAELTGYRVMRYTDPGADSGRSDLRDRANDVCGFAAGRGTDLCVSRASGWCK